MPRPQCAGWPDILKPERSLPILAPDGRLERALNDVCCGGGTVLAKGVGTSGEYDWLLRRGVRLFQEYLFGRPVTPEGLERAARHGEFILSPGGGRLKC